MKRLLFGLLVCLSFSGPLHAEPAALPVAIEVGGIRLLVDAKGNGEAIVSGCTGCPLRLKVDAETKFRIGRKSLTLDRAKLRSGRGGTIKYNPDDKKTIYIQW